jgi:hypothetical protein
MATLGLKRQGKLWALHQGTEMISSSEGGGVRAAAAADGRPPADGPEAGEPVPDYNNAVEYDNFREALAEAGRHAPLDDPDKESQRRQLQLALEQAAAAFASRHARNGSITWNQDAVRELDALLRQLNDLLKMVGLSVTSYGHLG